MNIYEQLLEIHEQLSDDEMWLNILDIAYDEIGADSIDDLIEKATENEDEGIICNLIDEGENILSLKDLDNYIDGDDFDEY